MISILSSDIEQTTENEKKKIANNSDNLLSLLQRQKIQYRTEICKT
jgi:hypothetical protein